MLIYHPAFDAYHCVHRILVITNALSELELAKLRILDYYLCFPAEVASIQLPQEHTEIRKVARSIKNEYRGPVSSTRAFRDMEPIQYAAARLLAASGIFDPKELEMGNVLRTQAQLPEGLPKPQPSSPVNDDASSVVLEYILTKFSKLPLAGPGGIKQRTGLMEHRYDVA